MARIWFLLSLSLFGLGAVAQADVTHSELALVRVGTALVKKQVALTDLTSPTSFQGRYFTVIEGQGDQPISFDAPSDLRLRAATVYNAFTMSRAYFERLLPLLANKVPDPTYLDQPMVLRLDMTHPFSSAIHYDLNDTLYNGAVTIPASDDFRDDATAPWGTETWFFAPKKQKVPNPASQLPGTIDSAQFKLAVFESLAEEDALLAAQNVTMGTFSALSLAENVAVSLGLSFGIGPILSWIINVIPAHVYLDAAMIPEIAANEYAHYALSPWLGLKRRFHVGEGYAHYFAAKITGLVRLQAKAGKYSKGYMPIRGDSSEMYDAMKEVGASAAMSSFTFRVLCDLEKALGSDGVPAIVGTLPYLDSSSSLNIDFTRAVFNSLSDLAAEEKKNSQTDLLWAHSVLSNRGF
jgi:hypothetical protein